MTSELFVQVFLDGALLNLCVLGVLGRPGRHSGGSLLLSYLGVCLVSRLAGYSTDPVDYVVLPLDSFLFSLFLVLAVLLLNSVYFDSREGHILWGTVTQFGLFLLLREVCFVLLGLFGLSTGFWLIYGVRMLSLLLWAALWSTGMLHWMKDQLSGVCDLFVKKTKEMEIEENDERNISLSNAAMASGFKVMNVTIAVSIFALIFTGYMTVVPCFTIIGAYAIGQIVFIVRLWYLHKTM